jgi:hypothetical protein
MMKLFLYKKKKLAKIAMAYKFFFLSWEAFGIKKIIGDKMVSSDFVGT